MSNFRIHAAKVRFRNNDYISGWRRLRMYYKCSFHSQKPWSMILYGYNGEKMSFCAVYESAKLVQERKMTITFLTNRYHGEFPPSKM